MLYWKCKNPNDYTAFMGGDGMRDRDKFRGCLIGGAAGDALGYAVEVLREGQIFRKYGERGITEYEPTGGVAQISDDTQMTLFTANGLLLGMTRGMGSTGSCLKNDLYHMAWPDRIKSAAGASGQK